MFCGFLSGQHPLQDLFLDDEGVLAPVDQITATDLAVAQTAPTDTGRWPHKLSPAFR